MPYQQQFQGQMMPYQQAYRPTYNPYMQEAQQSSSLIRVTGIEGAKAYQMNPNSTTALFDSNEDFMYIKSTDGAGFPTIRTFSFTEVFDSNTKPKIDGYVSKEEFETFKQEVTDYVQQFIQQQTSTKQAKQTISTNGISEGLGKSRGFSQTDVSE